MPIETARTPGNDRPHIATIVPAHAGEHRRRVRWPRLIEEFATAAVEGSAAVAATAIRAARPIVAADAAALVHWQHGRPVVVTTAGNFDVTLDRRPREGAGWAGERPSASVSVDPRTDLVVCRTAPIGFSDTDLEALRALAELVNWAGRDATPDLLLRRFAARAISSLEPEEVLVATADAVAHLMRAEIAGVLLLDATGTELEMRCAIGNTKPDTARLRIRPGQGLAGRVLESGRPARIDDYSTDPRSAPEFMELSDVEGTCAAIAAPLRWDGRTTGALCAWRRRRAPFTDEDESLLEAVAELCGAGIHHADCFQAQRSRAATAEAALGELTERFRSAERDLHVYSELIRIAAEGHDVAAVVHTVSALTGGSAVAVADDGHVLAGSVMSGSAGGSALGADRLAACVARMPRNPDGARAAAQQLDDGSWLLVAPVRAASVVFGQLALALPAAPTTRDELAAELAAVVSALLLAREEAAVAATRRVQSEFVWDLLDGRLPDSVEAGVRARHLGMGFRLPARVFAIEIGGLAGAAASGGWNPERLERTRSGCTRLINRALEGGRVGGAVLTRRADLFALIVPTPRDGGLAATRRLVASLRAVEWPDGLGAAIGVSGPVEHITGFRNGWREARLARSAAGPAGEPGIFEDLGVLQFLLAPTSRADLDGFARRHLGPVLDYDARHATELVKTLDAYLAAGCSTRRTAADLCIHHRTVSYRLARIAELTGLRLDEPEDRFRIQLAAKILALADPAEDGELPTANNEPADRRPGRRSPPQRATPNVTRNDRRRER